MGSDPGAGARPPALSIDHTIVSGDTLYSLARHYGTSVQTLMQVNGISDVLKLQTGTVLRVPVDSRTAKRLEIERFIERSEAHVRSAHFEAALESADAARSLLNALPLSSQRQNRVRLEIVSATVYVALGDRDAAVSSLRRALQADPDLALNPADVSPKVLSVFHAAREPIPATR